MQSSFALSVAATAALASAVPAAGRPQHLVAIGICGSGGVTLLVGLVGESGDDDSDESRPLAPCHAVTASELKIRAKRPRRP